jgi:hypothetical protein
VRRICLIAVAAALLAPQAAQAATIVPLKPCYRSVDSATRENVHVEADGFTPGSAVDVAIDGVVVAEDVVALADGKVSGEVSAPYRRSGEAPFTLTVTENDRPANTVSAASRVAALAMRLKPARAKPSSKVRFIGRGFTDGALVYGHYLRAGKLRKTVQLGPQKGLCGTIDVRKRQIPVSRPKTGRWTLQVDNQAVYSGRRARPPGHHRTPGAGRRTVGAGGPTFKMGPAPLLKRTAPEYRASRQPIPGGPLLKLRSSAALALALGLAAAPSAHAATVGTPAPCVRLYPGVPSLPVTADGFPAGSPLTFKADGATIGSGMADPAGHFDNLADPNTWFQPQQLQGKNVGTIQLTAEDGVGTVAGPVAVKAANLTITGPPGTVKPRKKVKFRMFGFQTGKRIYLHIRRGSKTKGRYTMGKAKGDCGLATRRMRFMPLPTYKTGTYEYWFGHSKKFSKQTAIGVEVHITRSFKAARTQTTAAGAWG